MQLLFLLEMQKKEKLQSKKAHDQDGEWSPPSGNSGILQQTSHLNPLHKNTLIHRQIAYKKLIDYN